MVTCPSPATATDASRRTQMTVVAWMVSSMEGEVYRRRRLQCADRLVLELPGMQHEPFRRRAAVTRIAQDGVADRLQMNSDLVRPPGLDLDLDQPVCARADDRQRLFPFDRSVDGHLALDRAADGGALRLAHCARCAQLG